MYPFSFKDYQVDINNKTTIQKALLNRYYNEYSNVVGFAEYIANEDLNYLQNLYESVLYSDIIVRYRITSEQVIKRLMYYLASNAAKLVMTSAMKKHEPVKYAL